MEHDKIIEKLFHMIEDNSCSSFIIGIEINGERYFVKSDRAATLIGYLYRSALKKERPDLLPNKFLPFNDIDRFLAGEQISQEKSND